MSRSRSYGGVALSSKRILRYLPENEMQVRVLDVGCGYDARLLRSVLHENMLADCIDVSISDVVKQLDSVHAFEGTIEDTISTLDTDCYDYVLLISVLEHLVDPQYVLNEIYRVLKPGGTLLLNVPTWNGKIALEASAFRLRTGETAFYEMNDHKMYYNKHDLWPMLVKAGFLPSNIHLSYYKFTLNLFAKCSRHEN